jgi:lipopolysaccharide exporter
VPFCPKFRLAKDALVKSLHFGKWIFISTALAFFCTQLDVIVVTKKFGVADVGRYQMASTIATLPMVQIGAVISAVLFPAFSKIKDDTDRLTRYFGHSLQLVTLVLLPLAVGITFLIGDFVDVVLGKQWWQVVPIAQILIFAGISRPIMSICDTLLTSTAYTRGGAMIQAIRLGLLVPSLTLGAMWFGIRGAAIGMSVSVTLPTLAALWLACRQLHAKPARASLASLALPVLPSAALMAIAMEVMRSVWPHVSILTVLVNGALGLSTYIYALLLLDRMIGGEIISVVKGLATAGFGRERTPIPVTDQNVSPALP